MGGNPLWQAVRDHFSKGWWPRAVQGARTPHNSTNHGAAGPTVQPGVQKVQPIGLDAVIDEQLHQVLQAAALSPVEAKPSL